MTSQQTQTLGRKPLHYVEANPYTGLAEQKAVEATPTSVVETLRQHGLDWTVEKQDLFLADGRKLQDRKAVLRMPDDVILGTAGKLFTPIQNVEAFAPLQLAIDKFGATVETAGAFGGGDRVWMLLRLPQKGRAEVAKGDEILPYFLVSNAHTSEKSQSLQARFTSIRVVCQNTLDAAIRQDRAAVAIPHHKNAKDRLAEIEEVVHRMYEVHTNSIKVYKEMAKRTVSVQEAQTYLKRVFKLRDVDEDERLSKLLAQGSVDEQRLSKVFDARDNALWLLDNGKGTGRTAWGAYNTVTEYIDHVSILRKTGALTKNGFETAAFGYGAYQKGKALDIALEMWMDAKKN